ncbi:hypothetical protein [Streptococcus cristatus]|nr:hypothetical protein [Streptococcus cristatus]
MKKSLRNRQLKHKLNLKIMLRQQMQMLKQLKLMIKQRLALKK